ncbi:MAG: glycoside hydrolase family 28 protein [Acidobacteriaceae bacterium]
MAAVGVMLAMSAMPALAAGKVCDVKKYGAKGDGTTKDTAAIQKAIDECSAGKGGGTVVLEAGTYVSAPILLKSNMTLELKKGATLLGSPDHDDYPEIPEFREQGHQALVSAVNAENVAITGEGVIDGNGASWWHNLFGPPPGAGAPGAAGPGAGAARAGGPGAAGPGAGAPGAGAPGAGRPGAAAVGAPGAGGFARRAERPRLIVFDHCKHVSLTGVTVQNSPFWTVVPYYSDDVVIRNVRITATLPSPNTDAIDPFSSSNVVIDHVYADVGDDNVAIKSGQPGSQGGDAPSKNITITDCTFDHGHGVSIGSEIAGGVQNVHVERVTFKGTDQAIRIKANRDRGNDVSNISYKDIIMDGVTKASISISEYYPQVMPSGPVAAQPVGPLTPHFHNIRIENVKGVNAAWAGAIVGLPESHVDDIVLKNVNIQAKKGLQIGYADVTIDGLIISTTDGSQPVTFGPEGKTIEAKK